MIPGATEAKAYLYRENGKWVVSLELPGWLSLDLLTELEHNVLADLNTAVDYNNPNVIDFVQMPIENETIQCHNCGATIPNSKVNKPPQLTWRGVMAEIGRLLRK